MELEECLKILKCFRQKGVKFDVNDLKCDDDDIEYIGEKDQFTGFGDIQPDILVAPRDKEGFRKFCEHYRKYGSKNLFPQTYSVSRNYCLIVIWSDGKMICLKKVS